MSAQRLKVLVIEDNRMDQTIFRRFIEKNQIPYDCSYVESVSGALQKLNSDRFDIIIADYFLSDGRASELFGRLANTPLIVITAAGDHQVAVQAMKAGAYDYLTKDGGSTYLKVLPMAVENAIKHKMAEERSNLLTHVITEVSEAVLITDLRFKVLFVNQAFLRTYGYSEDELLGRSADRLWSDTGTRDELIRELLDGRFGVVGEFRQLRADESSFTASASISLIGRTEPSRAKLVWIIRDISEEKRLAQLRESLESRLRESRQLESIGRLAGGVAHEFNNILASIIGFTELCQEDTQLGSIVHQNLGEIAKAGVRGRALVEHMLAFTRRSSEQYSKIDLRPLCEEVISEINSRSLAGRLPIKAEIDAKDPQILGMAEEFKQLLTNLLSNSIHATAGGGEVVLRLIDGEFRLAMGDMAPGEYCRLEVRDSGVGMAPEVLERVFEPFFTTRPIGEGSGLGMSAVHGIVGTLGGSIEIQSKPGVGTTVSVLLPTIRDTDPALATASAYGATPGSRGRILFVDDEEALVTLGTAVLGRQGYQVVGSSRSDEALEIFSADPAAFDLVITDFTMPKMSGLQLGDELKKLRPGLPMILVSGFTSSITPESALNSGFSKYISKPYSVQLLYEVVEEALSRGKKQAG